MLALTYLTITTLGNVAVAVASEMFRMIGTLMETNRATFNTVAAHSQPLMEQDLISTA